MSDLLLIIVVGKHNSELTSSFSIILDKYESAFHDTAQSVSENIISYGVILDTSCVTQSQILDDIKSYCQQHEWHFHRQLILSTNQERRFIPAEQHSYVLTLMTEQRMAQSLLPLMDKLAQCDFNIEQISQLSALPFLEQDGNRSSPVVLEIELSGVDPDIETLREELLFISAIEKVDLVVQESRLYQQKQRLVVFDMDSTLIDAEVIDLLAEEAGVGDSVSVITERAMQGKLDFNESYTQRLMMLEGLDVSCLERIAEGLTLNDGAERLIRTLKILGFKTAIVSGGFTFFAQYLQERLGIDEVFANELDIENGLLTGRAIGDIIDGDRKALLLQMLAKREGISMDQVIAVGDGANDLPMLNLAGLGIAFRAKPQVKRNAKHSISIFGLGSICYLLGMDKSDLSKILS